MTRLTKKNGISGRDVASMTLANPSVLTECGWPMIHHSANAAQPADQHFGVKTHLGHEVVRHFLLPQKRFVQHVVIDSRMAFRVSADANFRELMFDVRNISQQ